MFDQSFQDLKTKRKFELVYSFKGDLRLPTITIFMKLATIDRSSQTVKGTKGNYILVYLLFQLRGHNS